jgi:hypothetical protein
MEFRIVKMMMLILSAVSILNGCTTLAGPTAGGGIPLCANDPQRCPDLIPVIVTDKEDVDDGKFCIFCRETERDGQPALEVSVKNQGVVGFHQPPTTPSAIGNPHAPASVTRVVITGADGDVASVDLSTPILAVGFSVDLEPVIYPAFCAVGDCHITISVDANETVGESKEGNNTVSCSRAHVD